MLRRALQANATLTAGNCKAFQAMLYTTKNNVETVIYKILEMRGKA